MPDSVRPWLFTIARTAAVPSWRLAGTVMAPEDLEPACDGLADDARRRADLDELIGDLAGLPEDQREALVLFVLGGLSQADVASVIGCAPGKVKALVFQARETMVAERQAPRHPEEIQAQLDVARGGVLRRAPLRRHLRQCEPAPGTGTWAASPTGQLPSGAGVIPGVSQPITRALVLVLVLALVLIAPAAAEATPPEECTHLGLPGDPYQVGVNCRVMEVDGHPREFIVYRPDRDPEPGQRVPVVFMFHGSTGTHTQFLRISGWREQADATGLVAVFHRASVTASSTAAG